MNKFGNTLFVVVGVLSCLLYSCRPNSPQPPSSTPNTAPDPTFAQSATTAPTPTHTALPAASTWVRPADGMTMVPVTGGSFELGHDRYIRPTSTVYLDAYYIDQTEVTTSMYARCVQEGVCQKPAVTKSFTRETYYGDPQYANYPVIWVRWVDAKAYCGWAGARLPTEAEWERASRGIDDSPYPWGNSNPTSLKLNYYDVVGDTTAVGSYPSSASQVGALDILGNVWEYVSDWWEDDYVGSASASNPQGPASGKWKVDRGGSYNSPVTILLGRNSVDLLVGGWDIGFRCARSAKDPVVRITPTVSAQPTLADFFKRCPSSAEVADVNARLTVVFIKDPTAGTLDCTAASGSADLTYLQKKAYQTIIIMKYLQFSQPLPWTDKNLYDWFTGTVKRIEYEYRYGGMSESNATIYVPVHPDGSTFLMSLDVWATGERGPELYTEPGTGGSWGPGLMESTAGLIHEARHAEGNGYPHTCGNEGMDPTLQYMGAYGVQYYFFYWLANYSDRNFLRAPGEIPNIYLETAMYDAYWELRHKICFDPTPTPGPIPTILNPIPNP